ncbi:sensor histidine kinase [Thermodesulfobacteriota bacterium]
MRWGILINLSVILVISGFLLFVVFVASLERVVLDDRVHQATAFANLFEEVIVRSESPEKMWLGVRRLCKSQSSLKLTLFDRVGKSLGGCTVKTELPPPTPLPFGKSIHLEGAAFPTNLFKGMVVIVDLTGDYPHRIGAVRCCLLIPPSVFAPAWKFFGAYLLLTQSALFLLGYLLFHRTVIGPIGEVTRIAGTASGLADVGGLPATIALKGDIQRIASSLRAMILKIVDDREKMETLVEELKQTNQDLESAQQALIRSEKLATVGRLAAGLSHEIGNPLQIIMGYVELLQRGPEPDVRSDILRRMDEELRRIHNILTRLLQFARPAKESVRLCDLNALLRDSQMFIEGRKGFRSIQFQLDLEPEITTIETEPEKIRQILVNLVFNAADALPDSGGKIILRTVKHEDDLAIEVQDNGAGIPEADLEKVFDPFFTTKEPGKGTGLGLAVCQGLAESLGGSMTIRSAEDEGTTVVVRLPVDESPVE